MAPGKSNGYMQVECGAIGMSSGLVIYLEKWPGSQANETLKFAVIPWLMEHNKDEDGMATFCSSPTSCVRGGSNVRFRSHSRKRATGTFSTTLEDGRKIEGTFDVQVRKQGEIICE